MSDDIKIELTVSRALIADADDVQQLRQMLGQAALEVAQDVLENPPKATKGKK